MVLTFRANGKADTAWLIWAVDSKTATLHPFLLLSTLCLYSTPFPLDALSRAAAYKAAVGSSATGAIPIVSSTGARKYWSRKIVHPAHNAGRKEQKLQRRSIHTGRDRGPVQATKTILDPHGTEIMAQWSQTYNRQTDARFSWAGGPKSSANKPMLDPHSTGDVLASLQHDGDGEWVTGGRWRTGSCTSSPIAAESSRGPRATTSNRWIVSMEVPGRQPSRPGRQTQLSRLKRRTCLPPPGEVWGSRHPPHYPPHSRILPGALEPRFGPRSRCAGDGTDPQRRP